MPVPLPEYSDKLPPVMLVPVPFGERKTMPTGVAEASPDPIIMLPVETLAKEIVPEPLAFSVRFSFAPEERAERATPLPAAALFTEIPVADEAVDASTVNAGLVAPFKPIVRADAEEDVPVIVPVTPKLPVTVVARAKEMLPVDILPNAIVPEPLASNVIFSFVPEEMAERATPPPAAADFTLNPVAADVVEASTLKVGFVVPAGPTAKALAEVDVIVTVPKDGVLVQEGAAPVLPINTCPVVPAAVTPNALVVLPYKMPLDVNVFVPVPPDPTARGVPSENMPPEEIVAASVAPLLTTKRIALDVVVPITKSAVVDVKNTLFAPFSDPVPVKPEEFIPKSP